MSTKEETRPPRELMTPVYRYREFIAAIGSDTEVQDLIRSSGFDSPPAATIRGWRTRNSIPGLWAPLLIAQAMAAGRLADPGKLIEGKHMTRRKPGKKPAYPRGKIT